MEENEDALPLSQLMKTIPIKPKQRRLIKATDKKPKGVSAKELEATSEEIEDEAREPKRR